MRLKLATVFLLLLLAPTAGASELSRFNTAVAEAYTHYRTAVFYLHTGNPAVAEFELQRAIELWNDRVMAFRESAPDAYVDDSDWTTVLDDVSTRLQQARDLALSNEAEAAEAELLPIRDSLAGLRARSGVRVFSDCIDEANTAMDVLWVFRHEPPDFADAAAVNTLRAQTAVTAYLYERCQAEAPREIAEAPEFQRIMGGTLTSLSRLWPAIDAGDTEVVISILREIRSFDRMLWLQFG